MVDLKQRTDSGIDAELDEIANHELPAPVASLVEEYDEHVGQRDRFLWKWIHALLPHVTLSSVPPEYRELARDAKTVGSMYVVLLDDLGERDRDKPTLNEASKIPFDWQTVNGECPDVDEEALAVAEHIWSTFEELLEDAPRRAEFRDILSFDVTQTLNAIEYSYLVNENLDMANEVENWIYECNNMMLFAYADVDLMFSPGFDRGDLSVLRRAVRRAQKMARIGNWVTTWERELGEADFTSGVVVSALERGLVTPAELTALGEDATGDDVQRVVDRVKAQDIEGDLLATWRANHQAARGLVPQSSSVDLHEYLDGMETVLQYHLVSRGMK